MKKYFLLSIIITIIIIACSKNEGESSSAIDTFHQDYYDVNIAPAIGNFKTAIEKQLSLTTSFKEDNSLENFENLKEQWLVSAKYYSKVRAYSVVPVKALFFDLLIYNTSVTPSRIEDNIAERTNFDSTFLRNKSTVTKGLGALEYLLYNNQNSEEALALLKEDTFRVNYMLAVTEEVLVQTNALINFWESGYKETFINATAISCTENARCLAFNQLINIIDVIRVTRVGKPAGLESSESIALDLLEAFRSENSLTLIRSSLEEIQYAYSESTVNFASIVNEIGGSTEVSDEIDIAFDNVYAKIDAIDGSLYQAISTNDANVELLYEDLFDLVKYFSVDAASILSVTIIPTDNDGD